MPILPAGWGGINRVNIARDSFPERLRSKWSMKIGRIYDLLVTPCSNNNFFIFVAAFFSAIPEAIFTVNAHDCSDIQWDKAKDAFKSQGRRGGGRHGRGGFPGFKGDGVLQGQGPKPSGFGEAAFKGGQIIERIGAKLLIIDAALDLGINWMSNALAWDGCGVPQEVQGQGIPGPGRVYGGNGLEIILDCVGLPGAVNVLFGIGGFVTLVPVGSLVANAHVNTVPFPPAKYLPPATVVTHLIRSGPGSFTYSGNSNQAPTPENGGTQNQSLAEAHTLGVQTIIGQIILFEHTDLTALGVVSDASLVVVQATRQGLLTNNFNPDPCSGMGLTGTTIPRR